MSVSTVSDAKRLANQRNARKSTGPRTPRGKAIAAANSLRHGLFSRDLLLPGEDAEELLKLKKATLTRLNPRDTLEMELVERVIEACWKLRRLQRLERLAYRHECEAQTQSESLDREGMGLGHREPVTADAAWQNGGERFHAKLDRLDNQQRRLDNALHRALRQLQRMRKEALDEAPTEFALQALMSEQTQHANRQNEATAAEELARAAQLSQARAKRERQAAAAKARRAQHIADAQAEEARRRQREIEDREDAEEFGLDEFDEEIDELDDEECDDDELDDDDLTTNGEESYA